MSEALPSPGSFYVAGGTLRPGAPSYIVRQADSELFEHLLAGDFCYVLTARQMGKSSLMARTAKRLEEEGVRTAIVDLTQIGKERGSTEANLWYFGVAHEIHRHLRIAEPLRAWWQDRVDLPALQRLIEFFRGVVLVACPGKVAVFIDEIDSTIGLPFADDFFAAIRACYNARAIEPAFERLAFALLGVASPDQLIQDSARTPFNIGQRIELNDFTLEEAGSLAAGLHPQPTEAERRLERVFHWTDGHPYLTQALCRAAEEKSAQPGSPEAIIDPLVKTQFLSSQAQREETNLKYARARLAVSGTAGHRLLRLYKRVRTGKSVLDDPTSPDFSLLKLSGVVKVSPAGTLVVRNRIYATIFDPAWVRSEMPADRSRQVAVAMTAVLCFGFLFWYGIFYPRIYIQQIQAAAEADAFPIATQAYEKLRANPFARSRAAEALAEFWDYRAKSEAARGRRDESLLARLKAVEAQDTLRRRKEARALIGDDYEGLLGTFLRGGGGGGGGNIVRIVSLSPDGNAILTAGIRDIHIWNRSGQPIKSIVARQTFEVAQFIADDRAILAVDASGRWAIHDVKTWSLAGPQDQGMLTNFVASGHIVASPSGKIIATSGDDRIRMWDRRSGRQIPLGPLWDNFSRLLAVSRDDKLALVVSREGQSTMPVDRAGNRVNAFSSQAPIWSADFSPDGKRVLIGGYDSSSQIWDIETNRAIGLLRLGRVFSVTFGQAGQEILIGGWDGAARLWNMIANRPKDLPLRRGALRGAVASADGRTIVAYDEMRSFVRRLRATDGQAIGAEFRHEGGTLLGSNGELILTLEKDGSLQIWNIETGRRTGSTIRSLAPIEKAVLSQDGLSVLTVDKGGSARLWSAKTGLAMGRFMNLGKITSLDAVSSSGRRMLVNDLDTGELRIWDNESGKSTRINLTSLARGAFSPGEDLLLTVDLDGSFKLWTSRTGQLIASMAREYRGTRALRFRPDGKAFVAMDDDWAHLYSLNNNVIQHVASRHLRGIWKGALIFPPECQSCVRLVLGYSDSYFVSTIRFDEPDGVPLQGKPKELLAKWEALLSLRFDDDMHIVPRWPMPGPIREEQAGSLGASKQR